MKRRDFLKTSMIASGGLGLYGNSIARNLEPAYTYTATVRPVTRAPKHHFFGYYGISPWNGSENLMVCLEVDRQDSMPVAGEKATIGVIDTRTLKFEKVAETSAWNYQQGAMLHWNPLNPDSEIYFNDKVDNNIITRKLNIHTGRESIIDRPIYALSYNGKYALSLDYGRLGRMRRVVGYSGIVDPNPNDPAPSNGGIYLTDMLTGTSKLIVTYEQVYNYLLERGEYLDGGTLHIWFNHVKFNKADNRFFFLARTPDPGEVHGYDGRETGMFTANLDGSDLFEAVPYGYDVSHFDWRNNKEMIATMVNKAKGDTGRRHYLFTDKKQDFKLLGEGRLDFDGHCVFGPDQEWFATDQKKTIRDGFYQSLHIYNILTREFITLFTLDLKKRMFRTGDLRCDFHPRWNQAGDQICIDAIDQSDGTRQLHVANLVRLR
jgi:hypothetical protein